MDAQGTGRIQMNEPILKTLPRVIVLAAGQGSRFKASGGLGSKLEALLQGRSVLEHVLRAVAQANLPAQLVTKAEGPGMGDSIAQGVRLTSEASGWLILPGDLPLISAHSLIQVAEQLSQGPHSVVVPFNAGQRGHPVGFQRRYFTDLAQLTGEQGAAAIVKKARALGQVLDLSLEDPGCVQDIDTLEDLERAKNVALALQRGAVNGTD